jgi:hypothetical protein
LAGTSTPVSKNQGMNESLHELKAIIEQSDFYEGESCHPVHKLLNIPFYIIKIAHLVTNQDQKLLARFNLKHLIQFDEQQKKLFYILQVVARNYVQNNELKEIPTTVYELTPNLLLPYISVSSGPVPLCKRAKKKKKKKSRKKKAVMADYEIMGNADNMDSTNSFSFTDLSTALDSHAAFRNCSVPFSKIQHIFNEALGERSDTSSSEESVLSIVNGVCQEYEELVSTMRDNYESIIQATNLKLYIKETQIEKLEDTIRKTKGTSSVFQR